MTTPNDDLETAKEEADAGLSRARQIADRSRTIGERWRQSRTDNNFRQMLREMATAQASEER